MFHTAATTVIVALPFVIPFPPFRTPGVCCQSVSSEQSNVIQKPGMSSRHRKVLLAGAPTLQLLPRLRSRPVRSHRSPLLAIIHDSLQFGQVSVLVTYSRGWLTERAADADSGLPSCDIGRTLGLGSRGGLSPCLGEACSEARSPGYLMYVQTFAM